MKKETDRKQSKKTVTKIAKDYLREPYARVLVPEEEGGFSAEILEFPGCYAQGDSPEETYRNLDSAAESWIEAALEAGQEIPAPSANLSYSGRVALRLPPDLHRTAMQKAQRDGVSLNQCLVTAVATWVGADNMFERLMARVEQKTTYQNVNVLVVTGASQGFRQDLTMLRTTADPQAGELTVHLGKTERATAAGN